jgi:hypothetical protein
MVEQGRVLRQFYDENYTHQEQFRSAWETLNKAEKKSWADRQAYDRPRPIIFSGWTVGSALPNAFISIMTAIWKSNREYIFEALKIQVSLCLFQKEQSIRFCCGWRKMDL